MSADLVRPRTFENVRRQRATRGSKRRGVCAGSVWGCCLTPVTSKRHLCSHLLRIIHTRAQLASRTQKIEGQQQAPRIGRTTTENAAASTHGAARRKGISRDFDFAPLVESGCDLGRLVHRDDERDGRCDTHAPRTRILEQSGKRMRQCHRRALVAAQNS